MQKLQPTRRFTKNLRTYDLSKLNTKVVYFATDGSLRNDDKKYSNVFTGSYGLYMYLGIPNKLGIRNQNRIERGIGIVERERELVLDSDLQIAMAPSKMEVEAVCILSRLLAGETVNNVRIVGAETVKIVLCTDSANVVGLFSILAGDSPDIDPRYDYTSIFSRSKKYMASFDRITRVPVDFAVVKVCSHLVDDENYFDIESFPQRLNKLADYICELEEGAYLFDVNCDHY